jgi:hypothetical protein
MRMSGLRPGAGVGVDDLDQTLEARARALAQGGGHIARADDVAPQRAPGEEPAGARAAGGLHGIREPVERDPLREHDPGPGDVARQLLARRKLLGRVPGARERHLHLVERRAERRQLTRGLADRGLGIPGAVGELLRGRPHDGLEHREHSALARLGHEALGERDACLAVGIPSPDDEQLDGRDAVGAGVVEGRVVEARLLDGAAGLLRQRVGGQDEAAMGRHEPVAQDAEAPEIAVDEEAAREVRQLARDGALEVDEHLVGGPAGARQVEHVAQALALVHGDHREAAAGAGDGREGRLGDGHDAPSGMDAAARGAESADDSARARAKRARSTGAARCAAGTVRTGASQCAVSPSRSAASAAARCRARRAASGSPTRRCAASRNGRSDTVQARASRRCSS